MEDPKVNEEIVTPASGSQAQTDIPSIQNKKNDNTKNLLTISIILLLLIVAAIALYASPDDENNINPQPSGTPVPTQTAVSPTITEIEPTPTPDPTANWEEYENSTFGFSFKYPENFVITPNEFPSFDSLDEPIAYSILLTQDVYDSMAQTPAISVKVLETTKTVDELLQQLKNSIDEATLSLQDPENPLYGAAPPKILSTDIEVLGSRAFTKVVRYGGPGAPNADITEYYIKTVKYVYVSTANYGYMSPEVGQDGTYEKETVAKIISTLRFL